MIIGPGDVVTAGASPYKTAREAVDYLRLTSLSSLYHLIRQQGLPHVRRGGRYLFDVRELDRWLRGETVVDLRARRTHRRSA